MPESFSNTYTFPPDAIPSAEQIHSALQTGFSTTLELIKHDRGDHGAPRAYACIRKDEMQFWVYWELDRPEIEISATVPLKRMIEINAAIVPLGGRPIYDDQSWIFRRRARGFAMLRKVVGCTLAIMIAVVIIAYLHWWGVLLVIALIAAITVFYIILLSRAFGRR